jgi:hypothetical protein
MRLRIAGVLGEFECRENCFHWTCECSTSAFCVPKYGAIASTGRNVLTMIYEMWNTLEKHPCECYQK